MNIGPNIEIQFNSLNKLEEVILKIEGKVIVHLETISEKDVWMGCYGDKCIHINFVPLEKHVIDVTVKDGNDFRTKLPDPVNGWINYGDFEINPKWSSKNLLDEIFFTYNNICALHIERMSESTMWMCIWDGIYGVHVYIDPTGIFDWDEDANNP